MDFAIFGKYAKEARCCLPVLIETARQSIEFRKELMQYHCSRKADRSPVTIYDFIIESRIVAAIKKEFPSDIIVGEERLTEDILKETEFMREIKRHLGINNINKESKEQEQDQNQEEIQREKDEEINRILKETIGEVRERAPNEAKRFWAIDPIDGTSGFKRGEGNAIGQYVIAISLIEENDCVFSAVAWPSQIPSLSGFEKAETAFFIAALNCGSYYTTESKIERKERFERVLIPENPSKRQLLPPNQRMMTELKMKEVANYLNLRYCPIESTSMSKGFSLSLGAGIYYIRAPFSGRKEFIFDIAPFSMFIEEAGGIATTGEGKRLFFENEGFVRGSERGLIFSNLGREFHEELVNVYSNVFEIEMIAEIK